MQDAHRGEHGDAAPRFAAGASLIGAGLIYLTAEAATAAAWLRPAYSYAANWISDLGDPVRGLYAGRLINSPLHTLMNLGLLGSGALFLMAAVLLVPRTPRSRNRVYLTCAALHALGLAMVALVPESTPLPSGAMHTVGALMAIGFGNLAVALGSRAADPFVRFRLSPIGAVLGAAGAASLAILIVGTAGFGPALALGPGVVERASVYPITGWEIWAGALLLIGPPRGRAGPPGSH